MHIIVSLFYWGCFVVMMVVVSMLVYSAIQILRGKEIGGQTPESKEIKKLRKDINKQLRGIRKDIIAKGKDGANKK